jgi:hypothetical protein
MRVGRAERALIDEPVHRGAHGDDAGRNAGIDSVAHRCVDRPELARRSSDLRIRSGRAPKPGSNG